MKNKFKNFPVVILPDDCGEYIPGQPLPPGAIINTPIPSWVWMAGVAALAAVLFFGAQTLGNPKQAANTVKAAVPPLTYDSVIEVTFITFTPKPPANSQTVSQTATPKPPSVDAVIGRYTGKAGTQVTVTIQSEKSGSAIVAWDDTQTLVGSAPVTAGKTDLGFSVPQSPLGEHSVTVHIIVPGRVLKKSFDFEVTR